MLKKRLNQRHAGHSMSVKLFYDDLQIIFDFLNNCCEQITISDNEHEFNSIDELKEKYQDKIDTLRIEGYNPSVSIEFKREFFLPSIYFTAQSNNEKPTTAFYQISEFLSKKKSAINYIFSPFVSIMLILIFMSIALGAIKIPSLTFGTVVIFAILIFCHAMISLLSRYGFFYSISLAKSHEAKHFLARKKDDILLLIFGGIVGSAITWLISYLTK